VSSTRAGTAVARHAPTPVDAHFTGVLSKVRMPCSEVNPSKCTHRFELTVEFVSGSLSVPFEDCPSLFDCELLEGSDLGGDGRSELPVVLSMASTSYTGLYRVTETRVEPLELAAPSDPGFLEPGPIPAGRQP